MQLTKVLPRLGRNDAKLVGRDGFLLYILAYSLGMATMMRFALPYLNGYFAENHLLPFPLSDIYPMFFVWTGVLLGAGLPGVVFGFLLLDEKDDNTLKAMLVTPLPVSFYVAYRVAVPMLIGVIMTIVVVLIAGVAVPPWWQLTLLAVGASLFAPISTLFYAVYAENRVQGFALAKFPGILSMVLTISWFVGEPLQLLVGLLPPYWVVKAYWLALEGNPMWVGSLALGIALQAAAILYLARRFNQVAYD